MSEDYSGRVSNALVGRRIRSAEVNGHYIELVFDDGDAFEYEASDGGYSCFRIRHSFDDGRDDIIKDGIEDVEKALAKAAGEEARE